jgi:hypothetical protein
MESLKGIDPWDENMSGNLIPTLEKSTPLPKIKASDLYATVITALCLPDVIPRA